MFHRSLRGADLHAPSSELVENNTGVAIPVLKAVTFNGMGAVYPQIVRANSNMDTIRGITQAAIETGKAGYVTALGFLNNVDTSAWAVNTRLYSDSNGNISSAPNNLPVGVVLKSDATQGVIYVDNTGITKNDLSSLEFPDALSLELSWDIAHPSYYSEPTYDISGKIIQSDVWDTSAKSLHIFKKEYTYTGPQLTQSLVTRLIDGKTLMKTINYDLSGRIISVTRVYTT